MKNYNRLFAIYTVVILLIGCGMGLVWFRQSKSKNREYRVEAERLLREVEPMAKQGDFPTGDLLALDVLKTKTERIRRMYITDVADVTEAFFSSSNQYETMIYPICLEQTIAGYARFDYERSKDIRLVVWGLTALIISYILTLVAFLYVKYQIITPFFQLSEVPYQLAKGDLSCDIKENKNRYFGKFLWGVSMLRDAIASQHDKELRLLKEKKMMLLSISHDVKTPLNAIRLYSKAIEDGLYVTDEEQKKAAASIIEKVGEIDGFVKEIIKNSTEDIISIEVQDSEYYLKELFEKTKEGFGERMEICKTEFEIGTCENFLMRGDLDRTYEALGNLIENAMKYGDGVRITIGVTQEENYQLLHVRNTGTPMEETELPHVFDSFYRGSNVAGKQGNGLGLYICSEIMHKMGGDIYAQVLEDGMEFVLVIPMC